MTGVTLNISDITGFTVDKFGEEAHDFIELEV